MEFSGLKRRADWRSLRLDAVFELKQGTTRQDVLDEAVRRFRRERPNLIKLCLKPSHGDVRLYATAWIRREYQRIMAEGAVQEGNRGSLPLIPATSSDLPNYRRPGIWNHHLSAPFALDEQEI
jgi:hypothetical protein